MVEWKDDLVPPLERRLAKAAVTTAAARLARQTCEQSRRSLDVESLSASPELLRRCPPLTRLRIYLPPGGRGGRCREGPMLVDASDL